MYQHIFYRAAHTRMYTNTHCCFDPLYKCFSCIHLGDVLAMKGGNRVAYGLSCGPMPIQAGFKDIVG